MLAAATLMMPLVSWGLAALPAEFAADSSALISALRTNAGTISMVASTSLMTSVGHGATTYAEINQVFISLSILAAVLVIIAVSSLRIKNVEHS